MLCSMIAAIPTHASPQANPLAAAPIHVPSVGEPGKSRASWRPLESARNKPKAFRAKGRMLLVMKKGAGADPFKGKAFSRGIRHSHTLNPRLRVVEFNEDSVGFQAMKAEIASAPGVEAVEPDLRVHTDRFDAGVKFKAVDMDYRPNQTRKARFHRDRKNATKRIRVGILDSGIDYLHPDLDSVVDGGINLIYSGPGDTSSAETRDSSVMDYNGHGTQVAGIIGAERNGIGIDGLSEASLVAIKAFDRNGEGLLSDVIDGIQWAVDHDIQVLNISCGTYEYSAAFEQTVSGALASGILIVAAAGNDRSGETEYPAAFPGVLAVGSQRESGARSEFSNFGSRVDLYAPGERTITTHLNEGGEPYQYFSGTSAACAHVSGLIAMGLSRGTVRDEVIGHLKSSANRQVEYSGAGQPEYAVVNEEAFLDNLRKEKIKRLSVTGFGSARRLWKVGESPLLAFRIQNTGTRNTRSAAMLLKVKSADAETSFIAVKLPSLKPGQVYNGKVKVPAVLTQEDKLLDASLFLGDSSGASEDGFNEPFQLNIVKADRFAFKTTAIWLSDMQPGQSSTRVMHVDLVNIGNQATPDVELAPESQLGGHCSLGKVPSQPIGASIPVPSLEPGASVSLALPVGDLDIPSIGTFTVFASLKKGTDVMAKYRKQMEAPKKGKLNLLYSQAVHRWIAMEAVKLLKQSGIFIPDLMSEAPPYLGDNGTYEEFGMFKDEGVIYSERIRKQPPASKPYWSDDFISSYMLPGASLVHGANDCDNFDIAFDYEGGDAFDSHFWKVDQDDVTGHTFGSLGHHHQSALSKLRVLMYGKSAVSGAQLENGAIDHYKQGYKKGAWYLMGHAVHLIGDLSVPSHTDDENWHGVWGDGYHDWVDHGNQDLAASAEKARGMYGGMINPYQPAALDDPVRFLAYTTAQLGNGYSFGNDGNFGSGAKYMNYQYGKDGNRSAVDYSAYMATLFAKMDASNAEIGLPANHPVLSHDVTKDEIRDYHWGGSSCEWVAWMCTGSPCYEVYTDCAVPGGHIDNNNSFEPGGDGHSGNWDRDLEAIERVNLNYAISAAAGLIYMFAKETGQIRRAPLPALYLLLQ